MNQQRLKQRLHYDPLTGIFTWRAPTKQGHNPEGQIAGSPCRKGYVVIGIDYKSYKAHRLAWLYMTGEWPAVQIDHRNTIKDDNRWDNLRLATGQQNCFNRDTPSRSRTGFKGVRKTTWNGRYIASAAINGKKTHLGTFDTPEEAYAAASAARIKHHGEFARP